MLCYCYSVESELSGVYCGICILLRQLEVEGCADLVTTAQKLRQKRPAIITNKVGISFSGLVTHLSFGFRFIFLIVHLPLVTAGIIYNNCEKNST